MRIIYTLKTRYVTIKLRHAFLRARPSIRPPVEKRGEGGERRYDISVVAISLTCHLNVRRAPHLEIPSCGSLVRRIAALADSLSPAVAAVDSTRR